MAEKEITIRGLSAEDVEGFTVSKDTHIKIKGAITDISERPDWDAGDCDTPTDELPKTWVLSLRYQDDNMKITQDASENLFSEMADDEMD